MTVNEGDMQPYLGEGGVGRSLSVSLAVSVSLVALIILIMTSVSDRALRTNHYHWLVQRKTCPGPPSSATTSKTPEPCAYSAGTTQLWLEDATHAITLRGYGYNTATSLGAASIAKSGGKKTPTQTLLEMSIFSYSM